MSFGKQGRHWKSSDFPPAPIETAYVAKCLRFDKNLFVKVSRGRLQYQSLRDPHTRLMREIVVHAMDANLPGLAALSWIILAYRIGES